MRVTNRVAMAFWAMACLTVSTAFAQSSTATSTTKQFEVVGVFGNELVVSTPEGNRELTVPDDFRFTVNGKPVSVHELKPGMKGTATVTTRTTMTPVTVTEVKDGTVAQVAGSSIVVRTAEGLRSFTQSEVDKRGVKILRDGKPAQLSDFHTGDRLSATIITTLPPATVTEREVQATLTAVDEPPAPVAAPAIPAAPDLAALPATAPAPIGTTGAAAAQGAAPIEELPKTAGQGPLIGLVGLVALALGAALASRRRRLGR